MLLLCMGTSIWLSWPVSSSQLPSTWMQPWLNDSMAEPPAGFFPWEKTGEYSHLIDEASPSDSLVVNSGPRRQLLGKQ